MPKKYVSIDIPEETYAKLVEAKKRLGARTWADFFDQLLKKYDACVELELEASCLQRLEAGARVAGRLGQAICQQAGRPPHDAEGL